MNHKHYFRPVAHLQDIDVYRFLELFGVTCPVAQHVIKKAVAAGQRGHKDIRRDWQDIEDSAIRKQEMLREDAAEAHKLVDTLDGFGEKNMMDCRDNGMQDDSERMQAIGQNGNDGSVYASFEESANFDPVPASPNDWKVWDIVKAVGNMGGYFCLPKEGLGHVHSFEVGGAHIAFDGLEGTRWFCDEECLTDLQWLSRPTTAAN